MGSSHELPSGTVTLLFCDIEGSTALARDLGDDWPDVLGAHRTLLRRAVATHDGVELGIEGDGLHAAFARARDAVLAAAEAQRSLAAHPWPAGSPVRVRMGLHTAEPVLTTDGYEGLDMHRAARVMAVGHGGQVLLTAAVCEMVGERLPAAVATRDLGLHALRDFPRSERLFQLVVEGLPDQFPALRTGVGRTGSLPRPLTPLLGRERELRQLTGLLRADGARLVTLTGPGGVGKTRLALELAHELRPAHVVSLASVADPGVVGATVMQSLGIIDGSGTPPGQVLVAALADEDLLLLLDNLEHLLSAAPLIAELLSGCPRLSVLITSREPLRIGGERVFPVAPLALPPTTLIDRVERAPATALFLERVRARDPAFVLSAESAESIVEICRRLDGLALALELAAARVGLLTPQELAARLGDALDPLGPATRDAPERQRTLHATMEWSFGLLDAAERDAFTALAAFRGGCTLEGAEAVTEAPLVVLESLMAKSLLLRQAGRLAMLETMRQYALQRLSERPDADDVRRRHAEHVLAIAQDAQPRIYLGDQGAVAGVDIDIDNVRSALAWAADQDSALLLELSSALSGYWMASHRWDEGRRWIVAALPVADVDGRREIKARLLLARAQLVTRPGEVEPSEAREALGLFDALGDAAGASRCLAFLSSTETFRTNWDAADALADQALVRAREAGDDMAIGAALRAKSMAQPSLSPAVAIALEAADYLRRAGNISHLALLLSTTGFIAITDEAYERADEILEEALEAGVVARDVHRIATVRGNQGLAALFRERLTDAAEAFSEELALCRDDRYATGTLIWEGLRGLAAVAAARGELERCAELAGAAVTYGAPLINPAEAPVYDRLAERFLDPARAALGAASWERARRAGSALTFDAAMAVAIEDDVADGLAPTPQARAARQPPGA